MKSLPRKLAAIIYADVAGYSRMTGEDEEGTHRMLRAYLDTMGASIDDHHGRVVHYAGDAVLAEFGTAVDALTCATAIQHELRMRNAALSEERQIHFRMGVNLGDVIVDGDEIYGEGVNVAARLQSLAEPGGICVSEAVRRVVGEKFSYRDMGQQRLKNITAAIAAYRVMFDEEPTPVDPEGAADESVERRLAGVLAVDVVRYCQWMGEREELTLKALNQTWQRVSEFVRRYGGRTFGDAGDSLMAEFPSSVNALRCAVQIQSPPQNETVEDMRLELRIGAHVADVMVDGDKLYGDGINIASRLQELAAPGAICLSNEIYRQARGNLDVIFEDLGEQRLKHIDVPIRAWQVRVGTAATTSVSSKFHSNVVRVEIPTLVVLPFENRSRDPEQEYFCDGLTEDLSAELSRFKHLLVISPHSAFAYKGKWVGVAQLARELGVDYVLKGSVRRNSNHLRVSAQLSSTDTNVELWAQRFDCDVENLFAVQDDIIAQIVATLAIEVETAERKRVVRTETADLSAYELYLKGVHTYTNETPEGLERAYRLFRLSAERDPGFARAWGYIAYTTLQRTLVRWNREKDTAQAAREAERCAQIAVQLDPEDYANYWDLGLVFFHTSRPEQPMNAFRRAYSLNFNDANFLADMAEMLILSGEVEEGIQQIERAMRLNPFYPDWYRWVLGTGYCFQARYEEAVAVLESVAYSHPDTPLFAAAAHALAGHSERARQHIDRFRAQRPHWTVRDELKRLPIQREADKKLWADALREAGLPEE